MTADELRRLDRVAHNRLSLWVALVMALIGLTAFVILFNLLPDVGEETSRATLMLLGVLISLAPAGLWLGVFYRLHRPEPGRENIGAGALVVGPPGPGATGWNRSRNS